MGNFLVLFVIIGLVTFLTTTTMSSKDSDTEHFQAQMKIYDALKIAVRALEKNNLMYREDYRLTASRVGNEWVFWFIFIPETIGLDVTVFVSDDGKIRFLPGF